MRTPISSYLQSRMVRLGLTVAVLGSLPLLTVVVAAAVGLTDDPNPNPVLLGVLFTLTFWPGLAVAALGAILHHRRRAKREGS